MEGNFFCVTFRPNEKTRRSKLDGSAISRIKNFHVKTIILN